MIYMTEVDWVRCLFVLYGLGGSILCATILKSGIYITNGDRTTMAVRSMPVGLAIYRSSSKHHGKSHQPACKGNTFKQMLQGCGCYLSSMAYPGHHMLLTLELDSWDIQSYLSQEL